jgi:acid phosphatase type 7
MGTTRDRMGAGRRRLSAAFLTAMLVACQAATVPPTGQSSPSLASSPAIAPTTAPTARTSTTVSSPTPAPSPLPGVNTAPPTSVSTAVSKPSVTLIAAGDIGRCDSRADERTARLAAGIEGTVLVLGDTAYENGSRRDFEACYAPSWGRLLDRTLAVPGNHEHQTAGAAGYFAYFGSRAGPRGRGWYARTIGDWRLITLDSECDQVGGCGRGSRQHGWLTAELDDHARRCTIVAFHRPRFSSGHHGDFVDVAPLWRLAVERGADIVLNGHEHSYERLGPMDADGRDDRRGATVFIVGTGGAPLRGFPSRAATSKVRVDDRHGVLVLELAEGGFEWRFRSTPDDVVEDEGSGTCH